MSEVIAPLLGFFLPPLVDFVNREVENKKLRFWVSIGASLLVALVIELLAGNLTVANFFESGALVFATAQVTYNQYWKRSPVRKNIVDVITLEERGQLPE